MAISFHCSSGQRLPDARQIVHVPVIYREAITASSTKPGRPFEIWLLVDRGQIAQATGMIDLLH
jgi:hypothetical protein